ncbi:hypothetical protein JDV02_001293 [Purpureocillium takamizusanense]|uniref:Uncharacterized protein n=1 Tax=Purpureocillium takamizusanense TaxID=2060973 RepID=A0A9Q8V7P8_9HYPO|nr:uncharacterized protein JDV02_001293 [Purpureocillium takamizusanense]UNI14691.1 hypothetical protein JDV02_001293 [Purpureocillium takamizusanense]
MGSVDGYVEFYVTCNPPLLPRGVSSVVQATEDAHPDGQVLEILYEPDIPWFKLITVGQHQQTITRFVQQQLLAIVEEDTNLFDPEQRQHEDASQAAFVDVTILEDEPRILPWARLEGELDSGSRSFDAHQFPADIASLKHQTTWRGLEEPGWDFPAFFHTLETHWRHAGAPTCISDLEALIRCQVTHNMAGNLAYVGSDINQDTLDRAISTLDSLLHIAVEGGRDTKHLIASGGNGAARLALRWLSHIGQERTTFVQCDAERLSTEYQRLQVSVRVRTEHKERNAWVSAKTPVATQFHVKKGAGAGFPAFMNYSYVKKHPTTVQELLRSVQDATDQDIVVVEDLDQPSTHSHLTSTKSRALAEADQLRQTAVEVWRESVVRSPQDRVDESWGRADSPEKLIEVAEPCVEEHPSREPNAGQPSGLLFGTFEDVQTETARTDVQNVFDQSDEDLICLDPQELKSSPQDDGEDDLLDFRELPKTERRPDDCPPDLFSELGCNLLDEGRTDSLSRHQVLVPAIVPSRKQDGPGKSGGPSHELADLNRHKTREEGQDERLNAQTNQQKLKLAQDCPGAATPKTTISAVTSASADEKASDRAKVPMTGASTGRSSGDVAEKSSSRISRKAATVMNAARESAEAQLKSMSALLQLIPGHVALELHFGRIYLLDISHSLVDVGSGPAFSTTDLKDILHDIGPKCLGFSSALTTYGPDMERAVQAKPQGAGAWQHLGTQVFYDFHCFDDSEIEFVIEVDASTFDFTCRGTKKELSRLFLHCASRAWDMQICATRAGNLDSSSKFRTIGRTIVASICARSVDGEVALEAIQDERLRATITGIRVRHVAKYRQGEHGESELSVIMVKRMMVSQRRERRATWVVSDGDQQGQPATFYEASITSSRAKELFMENQGMKIGQRASWDCHVLEAEGVFKAICRPAFEMIALMDEIGMLNDNGQRLRAQGSFNDTIAESRQRRGKTVFW